MSTPSGTDDRCGDFPTVTITVAEEALLRPLARRLLAALPRGAFVALQGDLGAGKTTFVKAVAEAAGIDPSGVISPTFGLVHEHAAPDGILLHADLYRLHGSDDLREIGWHDAVARADWVFVEWPDRAGEELPTDRLEVAITIESPTARTFRFVGRGIAHAATASRLHD